MADMNIVRKLAANLTIVAPISDLMSNIEIIRQHLQYTHCNKYRSILVGGIPNLCCSVNIQHEFVLST